MTKPVCVGCGNTKTWKNVQMVNGKNKLTCAKCNAVTEVEGGVELEIVTGDVVFGFGS